MMTPTHPNRKYCAADMIASFHLPKGISFTQVVTTNEEVWEGIDKLPKNIPAGQYSWVNNGTEWALYNMDTNSKICGGKVARKAAELPTNWR